MTFEREPNAEPIPGYRLIELLGSGGFGEVWKCEAPGGLYKAMKFVYGNLNSIDGDASRAEQELGALNRVKEIRHPFVLSMDRIEVVDGELVIVMELADSSLHDRFQECQAAGLVGIPHDDLVRYLRDAAEALDHMIEKHQLQHLDIKPRNLFLISDRVKVADFGLVKRLERQSGIMGSVTPLYAPPETFAGHISAHSDQYSLAIVYQELLTGQRPFDGKTVRQLVLQHTNDQPELRLLPEAERPVVARALAKNPADRFPNCLAFIRALYNARNPVRIETGALEPTQANGRPKSMAETMDDIYLGHSDAGASPAPSPVADSKPADEVGRLGMTMNLPDTGALRPTVILGLGSFGRRALLELRCRFIDRFADLRKIPLVRFLYVDPDKEAAVDALRGAPETACSAREVCHLPLQPVGNYRRRSLDQLSDWLPREKLYAMPRALQTQGSRALGRLAFADNHLRLMGRLRKELQQASHPDSLYESVNQTGLALRDNKPRIYVIAAAGGGSSGLLVDLGYALRRLLTQLRHPDADVVVHLFCGAPEDPATPKVEQANVYATLTELNHFADPDIPFTAQYGADGPRTVDQGRPYTQVYLLKQPHRCPEALRDTVAHLGSYLFHELTTPLGLRLDRCRSEEPPSGATPFRSFGTYAVWFPRGLLLRLAAREACAKLLADWQRTGDPGNPADVEAAYARLVADPDLRSEAVCVRLQGLVGASFDGNVSGALTTLLAGLEEQSQQGVALDDPGGWADTALSRVQDWVGVSPMSETESGWRRSRLGRAFLAAVQQHAAEWDERLVQTAFQLLEQPGGRVAAGEALLQRLIEFVQQTGAAQQVQLEQQSQRSRHARAHLEHAHGACRLGPGSFSLFGGRARRHLRVFMDHLAAFSRQRLVEEVVAAGLQFYAALASRLNDRIRELAFCRQRLRHVQEHMENSAEVETPPASGTLAMETNGSHPAPSSAESYWETIRDTKTARLVLPDGGHDLEGTAKRFVATLTPEQWAQLDQTLQDQVLAAVGGLHHAARAGGDLARVLSEPMLTAAAACLGKVLPVTDVAQAELAAAAARGRDLPTQIRAYFENAMPAVPAKTVDREHGYLLVPTSKEGKEFGDIAVETIPSLELVRVPGQADLMFCREQGCLASEELQRGFRGCRQAYEETAHTPQVSSHARFDIQDWAPLV
jgi:serine/threonine protein kinase